MAAHPIRDDIRLLEGNFYVDRPLEPFQVEHELTVEIH